jgi:hypothetical protein
MGRHTHDRKRGHRKQKRKFDGFTAPPVGGATKAPNRIQLTEQMVIPDGRCPGRGRKLRYLTEDKADAALADAQRNRAFADARYVENRYYPCPIPGCNGYHLTSRTDKGTSR